MAAQITLTDVKALMAELGFTVPDVVLNLLMTKVSKADPCLDGAGYDDETQTLMKLYAVVRLAALSGARKLSSESAPSGASRSFSYDAAGTDGLYQQILDWDTSGCLSSLGLAGTVVGFFDVVGDY
ncbi:hypothetical protein G3M83_09345 [Rouxiella badensis]|uniref:DUF7370 family protein n=1 Tax=Rouxiella badensis TaxID=1646377 RepID=UPI0013EF3084|nr:hypothetical protein [Rouxiella badensis]QII37886.1 hypothetical protein G3M83_09345 [Rouxiella badensis]